MDNRQDFAELVDEVTEIPRFAGQTEDFAGLLAMVEDYED